MNSNYETERRASIAVDWADVWHDYDHRHIRILRRRYRNLRRLAFVLALALVVALWSHWIPLGLRWLG